MNSTSVSFFTLNHYRDVGLLKYLYFLILLMLYVVCLCSNLLLIVVICMNRSLHEPMYLFLCSLFVNELYGATGLFPFLLIQVLSDVHTISLPLCFLQIYFVFTYGNVEMVNLTIMSYDRYLAICHPLQYNTRMSLKKVGKLIALIWLFPFIEVAVMVSLSRPLTMCGHIINKVYCDNYSVVKLACFDTVVNNVYGIFYTIIFVGLVIFLNGFSYIKIFKVCFSGSKQTRQKALSTCSPHLASLINFSFGCFFEIVQSRFDMSNVLLTLRIFLSVYFFICQPIFNPLIYGFNLTKIRILCRGLLVGKR
ncbi:olfactory receptor 142-like [Cynoglossus semilaevis]|uniref:olfactory receptor 142-like n=1 Tax=Cynoglossus semilaevis TaxID=244447 RepID=UPI00049620D3|nr:olfactory receptor 142-like [Cynoglossus semilaevis]